MRIHRISLEGYIQKLWNWLLLRQEHWIGERQMTKEKFYCVLFCKLTSELRKCVTYSKCKWAKAMNEQFTEKEITTFIKI